jgi:hypothetical protein
MAVAPIQGTLICGALAIGTAPCGSAGLRVRDVLFKAGAPDNASPDAGLNSSRHRNCACRPIPRGPDLPALTGTGAKPRL